MTEEETSTQVIEWNVNDHAIAEIAEQCKDIDAYEDLDAAKAAKKGLTKMRTALGDAHKETKAGALAFGRKVDAEKNRLLVSIRKIEDPISAQLDEIKNLEVVKEEERIYGIEFQLDRLRAFANDRHSLDIEQLEARIADLTAEPVNPDIYQEMFDTAELTKEDGLMKLRITLQNEKERIEEEAKQAEVAAENAAKQKELDERQAKMDLEDAERQAINDKADAERREKEDKENRERQEKLDEQQAEQDAAQKLIDDENERIAKEAKDKADEEERLNLEAENEARALEQAPDREKLLFFANLVDSLIGAQPTLATDTAKEILQQANAMLIEVAYDIRKSTEEMK
jgi:hypothetical protein